MAFRALTPDPTTRECLGVLTGVGAILNGRDSARYAFNDEDLVYSVPAYKLGWHGGRNVQNLFSYSEELTNSAWAKSGCTPTIATGITAPNGSQAYQLAFSANGYIAQLFSNEVWKNGDVILSCWARMVSGSGGCKLRIQNSTGGTTISLTETWTRISRSVSDPLNTAYTGIQSEDGASPGSIYATAVQLEDATGRADTTTPSEYASTDVAGSDGIKVFACENGNSVASNVVTEAVGADLSPLPRLRKCPAATNSQIRSNDLADAEWTASNMAVGNQDETGIDGYPASACTIRAAVGNATLIANAITAASDDQTTKWFIKRKAGTGNIDLTVDNGATWTTVTTTAAFQELIVSQAAVTNPQIGIRIVTLNDSVIVANAECHTAKTEVEVRDVPPIFTTTAAVSVTADEYTADITNHDNTGGTWACEWTPAYATSEVTGDLEIVSLTTSAGLLYYDGTNGDVESSDGTNTSTKSETVVAGTTYDLETAFNGGLQVSVDAVAGSAESYDGAFTVGTDIELFRNNAYVNDIWELELVTGEVIEVVAGSITLDGATVDVSVTENIEVSAGSVALAGATVDVIELPGAIEVIPGSIQLNGATVGIDAATIWTEVSPATTTWVEQ